MKKIFSILVVVFFGAATFVLVPQSNYLAFAEDDVTNGDDDGNDKSGLVGRNRAQVSSCNASNCSRDKCMRCTKTFDGKGLCVSACHTTQVCKAGLCRNLW